MADVVVTVPMRLWGEWIAEGDPPGESSGELWDYYCAGRLPQIQPGERVYVAAHGRLRGWAPLVALALVPGRSGRVWSLRRDGGAVACTIAEPIRGFRGWRYRWWPREAEIPFPDWRTP